MKKLASAATISSAETRLTQFSFVSYFGRVNYKFNNRYLFGISARQDGSSRFGKNSRYGFFPAVSAGWIMTEEHFLKDNGVVSFLKLRGIRTNVNFNDVTTCIFLYNKRGFVYL